MTKKWTVLEFENSHYTYCILEFLLEEYCRIFGHHIMYNADCIVYNAPHSRCPRFIHSSPLSIRLRQSSLSLWSQTIFQLSHELCHYAMYQTKANKNITLSWFEEIICEAVSLYALEYSVYNWNKCKLSQMNPTFYNCNKTYLEDELNLKYTNEFKQCNTIEKLKNYEFQKAPENQRSSHKYERNIVYKAISANPLDLKHVLNYTKYIDNNGITINFKQWMQDNYCNLLNILNQIQPIKL